MGSWCSGMGSEGIVMDHFIKPAVERSTLGLCGHRVKFKVAYSCEQAFLVCEHCSALQAAPLEMTSLGRSCIVGHPKLHKIPTIMCSHALSRCGDRGPVLGHSVDLSSNIFELRLCAMAVHFLTQLILHSLPIHIQMQTHTHTRGGERLSKKARNVHVCMQYNSLCRVLTE